MRKLSSYFLVCITLLCFMPTKARASHAAGAELLFQWLHDSTYQLFYKFYRDCGGIQEPNNFVVICYHNSCNTTSGYICANKLVGLIPPGVNNGSEVLRLCQGDSSTCTKPSSNIPGYREWWYTANITLPSRCNYWTFNCAIQARNNSITNITSSPTLGFNLYTEATLDNLDAQGDTSPFFSVKPVPYICAGVPYVYNNGAYDLNNDQMVFNLVMPMTSASGTTQPPSCNSASCPGTTGNTVFVTTSPSYNLSNNPLQTSNTFSLNSANGLMSFTPTAGMQQYGVVAIRVDEYRNNIKIGSVMRDIQIIVLNTCNNIPPNVNLQESSLNNCTLNNDTITACAGTPFSFCYQATSPDTNAVLIAQDNSSVIMPGSNVTYSNQQTDTVTGCFSWFPTVFDTGFKIFTITVNDSSCKPPGILFSQTFTMPIYIWPATYILNDTSICKGDTTTLLAVGGGDFTWSVLPGGAPLSTLSCTNCNNPTATPNVTTRYVVTSGITNAICKNKDTVTITVVQPIQVSIADTTTCVNNSLPLFVKVTTANNYSVKWQPNVGLNNDTIINPIVSPPSGTSNFTYIITVTARGVTACAAHDTFHLRVLQGYKIFNNDTAICIGKSVQVGAWGDPAYFYNWSPLTGVSNPNSLTPVITPPTVNSQIYLITATYPGCRDSLNHFKITVEPIPTVVAGASRQICSGDTVHLDPIVAPPYAYLYNWSPGSSMSDPTQEYPVFSGLVTNHLTLTVTSPLAKCSSSDSVTIVVITRAFLRFAPADTAICPYDTIQIHVMSDATDMIQSFYWSPKTFISDINNADPFVWPPSSAYYTVYAKDTAGCRDTLSMFINIRPAAIIDLPDSVSLYPGETYQIKPGTNCSYFKWFPPTGLSADSVSNPIASPVVNTKYIVNAKTDAGCVVQDSIRVFVEPDSHINVPNVFTPGSGVNPVLTVLHIGAATLKSFSIFNRWGEKVFESNDINKGWDGTFNGKPQPVGVYVYTVEAYSYKGVKLVKNGNVTLLR